MKIKDLKSEIRSPAAGFVTAGGRSSRMGRDKAWLEINGKPLIERVIAALAPVTTTVSIIANSPGFERLGLPVFSDTSVGTGPLEAIRTALARAQTSRVVLAACDMPFLRPELFSLLLSIEGDYQAVVPSNAEGRLEPMCAVYHADALNAVTSLIESGGRKVSLLFDLVPTRVVTFDELTDLPEAELFFLNVNTPADLASARRIIERG